MHLPAKIHQYFEILAKEQPSAPARISDDRVQTYAELDEAADALACELLSRGLNTQEAIGVLTVRSAELPIAFLAILKAGGVYVPMVADLPADRLVNMAQQAGLRRLIVLDRLEPPAMLLDALIDNGALDPGDAVIRPEMVPSNRHPRSVLPEQTGQKTDLAAILFTSGSTGTPKGVMIRHDACANMALGHIAAHRIGREDRILLSSSPGFILGFRELCLPFMSGAAFVPVSRSVIDAPDRLVELMTRHRVSIALFTPSYLRLLNGVVPQGLRCIITAGERPNVDEARYYARHLDYWNVHGATEVCGTICMHQVDPAGKGPIPSGRPFANTAVYLLDENGAEVANGAIGEIHIVGVGVSPGYLKQAQLNAESFIETRYGRAFRTRDLGRWNENGELETLGRADDVVKISGQSVSLSEIEKSLLRYPGVLRASAMQLQGQLIACVECPDPDQKQGVDWREFLGRTLPTYMIPAQVAVVPKMPISSAGKVDRKALVTIVLSLLEGVRASADGIAPQGPLEQAIAGIWQNVVGIQPIFREDNFFAVGGTSLMAIEVSQRLQGLGFNVTVQMVLASLTVAELATRIAALGEPSDRANIAVLEDQATAGQEDFWIAAEIGLAPAASHIVRVLAVRGASVPAAVWQSAWGRLVDRHPALRSAFHLDDQRSLRWRTVASPELAPPAQLSLDRCSSIEEARDRVSCWANQRFQLSEPPLVRAGLIEVEGENEPLFWLVLHHSVVDGISAQLLLDDLLALLGNRPLPPAVNGLAIASHGEQQYLVSPRAESDRQFWRNRLDALVLRDSDAFNDYLSERSRPAVPSGRGAPPLTERLDAATVAALSRLAKAHGAGLHGILLAILAAEVRRRVGLEDVMIGSGISIRPAGGETAIGHFVNVLPVIISGKADQAFGSFLRGVQSSLTETVDHAGYPAGLLFREFRQRHPQLRRHSPTALFDIALTAISPRTCIDRETGITLEPRLLPGELEHPAAGLDLSFSHEPCPEDGSLNLLLTWDQDACSQRTASAWLAAFASWARRLAEQSERIEQPLPALLPDEVALLDQWEQGPIRPRPNKGSHQIFEDLVDRQPQQPAVVGQDLVETRGQLDARANGIARHLIELGVARGSTVAVLTIGSADLPATVLGIWKAGGIYLPLADEQPPTRLAAMVKDARAAVLIVLDGLPLPEQLADTVETVVRLEECPPSDSRPKIGGSPEDVAFIVYTSGTTGIPKGVPLTHEGYINAVHGVAETVGLLPDDRIAQVATVGFDASLWELGHGLLTGITLVPVSKELRDNPWGLKRYYRDLDVTIAFHTPSYLRVSEQVPFEGLRILLAGGEASSYRDAQHYADRLAFWNFYGPTEATIVVLGGRVESDHPPDLALSVGRPLANTRISLRRQDGSRVPPGQRGELWLGGLGITGGYLNRPDLNAERFIITPEGRFYRSGDFGRWTADGRMEICGRIDDQVKLNGQRVELGEIEQVLCTHPAVDAAVVIAEQLANGAKVLRAFICPKDLAPAVETLTDFIADRLPVYMFPASITSVVTIPLTPAGKVDRQRLLSDFAQQQGKIPAGAPPQNPFEVQVAAIWAEILGVPVARNDNFFALGGNSLLAATLAYRISENLGRQVSPRTLFAAPTLASFVAKIGIQPTLADSIEPTVEADLATGGEREFWIAEAAGLDSRPFIIPMQYYVEGDVAAERWRAAWSTLVDRHQGLRTFFQEDPAGQLRRRIATSIELAPELTAVADKNAALAHIRLRQAEPLPMGVAPLWRVGVVETQEEGAHFFWLALHHAIGDGQSINTLINELTILLDDGVLPAPPEGKNPFAYREQGYLRSMDFSDDRKYWRNLMKEVPGNAFEEWPLDRARSSKAASGNHRFDLIFDRQTTSRLKTLARNCESSFHSLMLTLLALEVRRRTGRTDVVIGTTASIRESISDAHIIGYGVNMLPLHLRPTADPCFVDLLRATHHRLAEALQHARYPFAQIYRDFWSEHPDLRHPQRYPLFDIAVTENPGAENTTGPQRFSRAITASKSIGYERTRVSPGLDIILLHEMIGNGQFLLQLQVNAALYSKETALSWFTALEGWARWLAEEPGRIEEPLPTLLPHEMALLRQWEQGPTRSRQHKRSHQLFEALVDRQPQRPAVVAPDYVETFAELDARANGIAHHLIRQGVVRGTTVAVLTRGSVDLPATVLGIWKAGGIYLPLAHELPSSRLVGIAGDAGATVLIVLDGLTAPEALANLIGPLIRFEDCVPTEHRPHSEGRPEDTAFIVYTSGTTGVPKGVPLSHAGYTNIVLGVAETVGLLPDDRISQVATVGFDASLWELGHGLLNGIALVPVSKELRDNPWDLKRYYRDLGVTVAFHAPSYLRVSEQMPFEGLRILFTGGEAPSYRDVQHYADRLAFWNFYGPTEATIVVLGGRVASDHPPDLALSVGRPLANTQVSLRREDGSRVPPGQQGELWLGGVGITGGYLNRPDLNAERFITTPEGRFYRSGDYARWTGDGRIEICGRIDHQIKLNGQRVELGEIEQTLRRHPAINEAVVLVDIAAGGSKILRAFIRTEDLAPTAEALTDFLAEHLPAYMLPASITPITAIPLTPAGKVDGAALFNCAKKHAETLVREAPQNLLEERVAAIWADLLGVPVGRNDNFFALGGNSLLAVTLAHRVAESLGRQVSARTLFASPTFSVFVSKISSQAAMEQPLGIAAETDLATEGEGEFWTAEKAGLDTRTFTIPVQYLIKGEVFPDRWQAAWSSLVERHEGLRTFFAEDVSGVLRRRVAPTVEFKVEWAVMADKNAALAHIRCRQADPLPMGIAPLWRVGLVKTEDDSRHFIWLALHHAVGDGQSIGTLLAELNVLLAGGALPPPGAGGRLFASREQSYFSSTEAKEDAEYWDNLLKQVPVSAFDEWPLDQARSAKTPTGNHRLAITLDPQTAAALKTLAGRYESSFHALMLTLLAWEVRRRTGRGDVVIGTTASTRESMADLPIVGYGVNMLPLHLTPAASQSFGEILAATQGKLAQALQHTRYPFARMYRAFWAKHPELRHPQRYPLFDIAVTENPRVGDSGAPQLFSRPITAGEAVSYERTEASPGQDIILIHEGLSSGELLMLLQLNAAVYSQETARSWFEALVGWARWLAADPTHAGQPLPLLLPGEQKILAKWEQGDRLPRPAVRFHELFEMVVDRPGQADRPAVITLEKTISYRALEEQANALAHALVQRGVGRKSIIAVLTSRSPNLPVAALAIWKAGATYLPLASDLPPERLAFIARDAGVSQLIALDGVAVVGPLADQLAEPLRPEQLSEDFRQKHTSRVGMAGDPADVAYILYTSGSTGEPKGTLIGHDSYVNLVLGAGEAYGLTADDRCLMFAAPSFDVSLSDIGVPLAYGAAVCPVSAATIESPNHFRDFLQQLAITVADITPTYLRLFEGCPLPSSLRILITGGEPPVPVDVASYAGELSYFNAYGPTENTITSTLGILKRNGQGMLTAGRPLPNTSVHICNHLGQPLPPTVVGEIWLGGVGLGRGYLNRPELTAAHFLDSPEGRRYRSGDLGRWSMTGNLEILGRIDDQVKLNGIRIELAEIEHALGSHSAISQAVALLIEQDNGSKSLWAVVRPLPGGQMPTEDQWRRYLAERLPAHMIPSGVVPLANIPLSASGKVDRSALLALLAEVPTTSGSTPPQDDLERSVAEVWGTILGKSPIHREDNFFALGGHSLLAIVAAHRLERSLGREVPARDIFVEPTLAGFAARLRGATPSPQLGDIASDLATTGQREFWTAEQAGLDTCGFNISLTLAVQVVMPSSELWHHAWNTLLSRHDALRTGFKEDAAGVLRRVIVRQPAATFAIQSVSSSDEAEAAIKAHQLQPFAMAVPGLWRAGLMEIKESDRKIFWLVMHHSVGDGLSLGIVVKELTALLQGTELAPLALNFSHSAGREEAYLGSETALADAAYWRQQIGDLGKKSPDVFDEWPLDRARPNVHTTATLKGGHCFRSRLDPRIADGLRSLARRNRASFHAFMLAFLGLEVQRRTGRSKFLLGTAASTRQSSAEAQTIGYFVNMLPLSCHLDKSSSIDTAVRAMQQELAETLQHSRYPFARIYGDFRREHPQAIHPTRYPLFDIAVTENPAINLDVEADPLFAGMASVSSAEISYQLLRNCPAQDLVLIHEGQPDGGLILTWFANAAIYTKDTAEAWFDGLVGWAHYLATTLPEENEPLPSLLPTENNQLEQWQNGPSIPLPDSSFPELFRCLAEKQPERPAIITDGGIYSYREVNARADRLAQVLLSLGLKRGEPIAVLTERSEVLPETVLALWKAGCCYLPLTADLPGERLAFMAKDAGVRILIVLDGLSILPELAHHRYTVIRPEELPEVVTATAPAPLLTADDLAYIIYTSGSTGVPKGVMLRHGGMLNLGLGVAETLGIRPDDRALLMSSPSFDLWISDLVMTWSVGGALVPVRRRMIDDIAGMYALLKRLGVTLATMSPSYLSLFERADLADLRILMTVGEPPRPDDVRHYATKLAYFNGYGPTENTAASSFGRLQADREQIAAGRPLANTSISINDDNGKPVPPGVIGEIWLGGVGLAAGYLNRPELTAANFIETSKGRRYRTGDLGRWLRSGELQVLGRGDDQVKLRGQRIELGEIEHRLAAYPGVQQAVAVVADPAADQSLRLLAFVTLHPQASAPAPAKWMSYLSESLPSYMIPSAIIPVDTIPLTAAGKVDRRALLANPVGDGSGTAGDFTEAEHVLRTAPQTSVERRVSEIWRELLGQTLVAREDDFFSLGGDSLKAIAVVSRLSREFECRVNDLYEHPVLANFAGVIRLRRDQQLPVMAQAGLTGDREGDRNDRIRTEAEVEEALRRQRADYELRIEAVLARDLDRRNNYRQILLTGATGYLGSYLLRQLLDDPLVTVTALVRGADDQAARTRLGQVLIDYFETTVGAALSDNRRLKVLASDLRQSELLLSPPAYSHLAAKIDAIYHCAANVNHIGHYRDFYADNVAATRHLLALARHRKGLAVDFHLVSTLSVAGGASSSEFRLFTEDDLAPETPADNYYIRTKQEAEQLVIAARNELVNASIYRVGNIGFATDSVRLQRNITQNAFFRQIVAFLRLGVVPVELSASICHVDVVAKAIVALADRAGLNNEIHHIETSCQDKLADFIRSADIFAKDSIRACTFSDFCKRLEEASDEPGMESAVAETLEAFGLRLGLGQPVGPSMLTLTSDRTQRLLERLGVTWPQIPLKGQLALLGAAAQMCRTQNTNSNGCETETSMI